MATKIIKAPVAKLEISNDGGKTWIDMTEYVADFAAVSSDGMHHFIASGLLPNEISFTADNYPNMKMSLFVKWEEMEK